MASAGTWVKLGRDIRLDHCAPVGMGTGLKLGPLPRRLRPRWPPAVENPLLGGFEHSDALKWMKGHQQVCLDVWGKV